MPVATVDSESTRAAAQQTRAPRPLVVRTTDSVLQSLFTSRAPLPQNLTGHFADRPMALTSARLRSVMLLLRDVPAAATFYNEALGLPILKLSDRYAELGHGGGGGGDAAGPPPPPPLVLKAAEGSEALVTTGYSPFLCFDVPDVPDVVVRALAAGAKLDGAIKHEPHGKVAVLRSPDGHMLGVYEAAG